MGRKAFALLILVLFVYVTLPLALPVAMGAVFAVLFFPWLERLESRKFSTGLASALLTLGVTLVFLIPAAFLIFIAAKTGTQQLRIWREAPAGPGSNIFETLMNQPVIQGLITKLSGWFPVSVEDIVHTAEDLSRSIGLKLADALGNFLTQLPGMVMGMAVMVVSIFFFLSDGRKVVIFVRRYSMFSAEQTESMIHSFAGICRSVILATVVSGLAQSFIYTIACLATGVGNTALIGLLVFLASFIPLIGSAPITFGVALHQILIGNKTAGIVLIIVALFVGLVDNLVRPLVLQGAGNLHPLLAFIAAFGGLQVFGFAGVFLGPIVAGLFVATMQGMLRPGGLRH